jgi:1-deoxy-D-xylulose-5-phosphate synthase
MQRAVDQVIHDVALPNLPVILALDRAGLVGADGETHQGVFDVALYKSVPNLQILSPAGAIEMELMLRYAVSCSGPVMIRYPKASCCAEHPGLDKPLVPGQGVLVKQAKGDVLIIAFGSLLDNALNAAELLSRESVYADVYNLRFLKPIDYNHLNNLIRSYSLVVIAEEGVKQGGLGRDIICRSGMTASGRVKKQQFIHIGLPDQFITHAGRNELLSEYGLDAPGIAETILNTYQTENKLRIVT